MKRSERISDGEPLQFFYTNQANRKQLSCFWLSQCFSTAETIPDVMLVWATESRGAIKRPHMIQTVCLQYEAPQKKQTPAYFLAQIQLHRVQDSALY